MKKPVKNVCARRESGSVLSKSVRQQCLPVLKVRNARPAMGVIDADVKTMCGFVRRMIVDAGPAKMAKSDRLLTAVMNVLARMASGPVPQTAVLSRRVKTASRASLKMAATCVYARALSGRVLCSVAKAQSAMMGMSTP